MQCIDSASNSFAICFNKTTPLYTKPGASLVHTFGMNWKTHCEPNHWPTSVTLLWPNGIKSLQPGPKILWKAFPWERRLLQQHIKAHSFGMATITYGWNVMVSAYFWPCAILPLTLSEECSYQPWSQCHWALDSLSESPWSSPGATDDLWCPASWAWPRRRPVSSAPGRPAHRWTGAVERTRMVTMDEQS